MRYWRWLAGRYLDVIPSLRLTQGLHASATLPACIMLAPNGFADLIQQFPGTVFHFANVQRF